MDNSHTKVSIFHSELYHDLIEGGINFLISPMTESLFEPLIESHLPYPPERWEWIDIQPDMTSTRSLTRITTTSKILLKACRPTYSTVGIVHIFHRKQLRRRRSINRTFAYPEQLAFTSNLYFSFSLLCIICIIEKVPASTYSCSGNPI